MRSLFRWARRAGVVAFLCFGACAAPADTSTGPGAPAPAEAPIDLAAVRLNDLQFVGTHNSYHVAPDAAVFERMRETSYRESAEWTAERLAEALAFTHPPLETQLDMGLRVFELDIHDDPDGGRYSDPGFLKALDPAVARGLAPVDPAGDLARPGFKVFHSTDTDVRSRCLRFSVCLETIRAWSDAHPGHAPIFIELETKEGRKPVLADAYPQTEPAPFDAASWARLHAEILSVFAPERILTPADVQGDFESVNAAVRAVGWPTLAEAQGRVVFLLLDDPEKQDAYAAFTDGDVAPLLFVSREPDDPRTGWLIRPTPKRDRIHAAVRAGFLVYTRADAGGREARRGDARRAQEAFDSGAQLIATDFPVADPEIGPYAVSFGGAYVRCNLARRSDLCRGD